MIDKLVLSLGLHQEMISHIQNCLPEEACGLLVGRGDEVVKVFPITNILHSPVSFLMDPLEQFNAMVWQEEHEMNLLAIYHSHPNGPSYPSEKDMMEFAYPGSPYIVWSLQGGQWHIFGFMISSADFTEIELIWR